MLFDLSDPLGLTPVMNEKALAAIEFQAVAVNGWVYFLVSDPEGLTPSRMLTASHKTPACQGQRQNSDRLHRTVGNGDRQTLQATRTCAAKVEAALRPGTLQHWTRASAQIVELIQPRPD